MESFKKFNEIIGRLSGSNANEIICKLLYELKNISPQQCLVQLNDGDFLIHTHQSPQKAENINVNIYEINHFRKFQLGNIGQLLIKPPLPSGYSEDFFESIANSTTLILNQINIIDKQVKNKSLSALNREAMFRYMLRHMNLGIIEFDTQRIIQYANRSFSKISGYSLAELIGNKMDIFPFAHWENIQDYNNDHSESFLGKSFELSFNDRSGMKKHWLISGSQIFDDNKKLTGTIGIILDITAHKQLQVELVKQKEIAEKASLIKERFLATMSHEIRNPLNVIIGSVNQMTHSYNLEESSYHLKNAKQSSDYLLSLLNNVLDYTTIDNEFILQKIKFNPAQTINEVTQYFQFMVLQKKLNYTIKNNIELQEYTIGDVNKIKQILYSLIGNAVKFTRKGTIEIAAEIDFINQNDALLKMKISDTGEGINKEKLQMLQEIVFSHPTSIKDISSGIGIGLPLSIRLIKGMNGSIKLQSERGDGTSLEISIPLERITITKSPNSQLKNDKLAKPHILIVEDQPENQKLAELLLEKNGYESKIAENGIKALEILKTNRFDLILMDIQMPEMDGLAATKFIRSNFKNNIPIIAVTANAFSEDIKHYLETGINDVIIKPYDEKNLIHKIKQQLEHFNKIKNIESKELANKVYNLATLREMCNSDELFFHEMLRLFVEITPDSIIELQKALENENYKDASRIAHRMKQSIGNMGMMETRQHMIEIERTCKNHHPDKENLMNIFMQAETQLKECINAIKLDFSL
jgi:PAS domain S-box-containing protein